MDNVFQLERLKASFPNSAHTIWG